MQVSPASPAAPLLSFSSTLCSNLSAEHKRVSSKFPVPSLTTGRAGASHCQPRATAKGGWRVCCASLAMGVAPRGLWTCCLGTIQDREKNTDCSPVQPNEPCCSAPTLISHLAASERRWHCTQSPLAAYQVPRGAGIFPCIFKVMLITLYTVANIHRGRWCAF